MPSRRPCHKHAPANSAVTTARLENGSSWFVHGGRSFRAGRPMPHHGRLARAMTEPSRDEAGGNEVRALLEPPTDTLLRCRGSVGNRAWTPSIRPDVFRCGPILNGGLIRKGALVERWRLYKIAHPGSRRCGGEFSANRVTKCRATRVATKGIVNRRRTLTPPRLGSKWVRAAAKS
jgi:hypothetical protein